jgi:DNA polymerase III psi subunit
MFRLCLAQYQRPRPDAVSGRIAKSCEEKQRLVAVRDFTCFQAIATETYWDNSI